MCVFQARIKVQMNLPQHKFQLNYLSSFMFLHKRKQLKTNAEIVYFH